MQEDKRRRGRFIVPLADTSGDIERVEVRRESHPDEVLAEITKSPSAPIVDSASAAVSDDTLHIEWSAHDDDGDEPVVKVWLSYLNCDSQDVKTSFPGVPNLLETLVINEPGSSLELPLDGLRGTPGGSECATVVVTASDGLNASADFTSEPFNIPNNTPEVLIKSPMDGQEFGLGEIMSFNVYFADDMEDGRLTNSLKWEVEDESGKVVLKGKGEPLELTARQLGGPGDYTVKALAVDSEGAVGQDSVDIVVVDSRPSRNH